MSGKVFQNFTTVMDLFEKVVWKHEEKIAVIHFDGMSHSQLTYRELKTFSQKVSTLFVWYQYCAILNCILKTCIP